MRTTWWWLAPLLGFFGVMLSSGCTGSISGPSGGDGELSPDAPSSKNGPGSGAGDSSEPVVDTDGDGVPDVFVAANASLRRLTAAQYTNTVRDLLGDVTVPDALEPDTAINGFVAVGSSQTTISPTGVEKYETASYDVAAQALADPATRSTLVTCTPSSVADAACAREVIARFGRRAFRRPLTEAEVDRYQEVAVLGANTLGDFDAGIELAVAAILQSPSFLFRVELGEPEPSRPGVLRYTSYEMASRLSYFLWNTGPDDALLDAAERGALVTIDGVRTEAERLLESPRARHGYRMFFTELLGLVQDFYKDEAAFPDASPTLAASAREGVLRTIEHVLFEDAAPFSELFETNITYVDPELARLYGVSAPSGDGFSLVTLPEDGMRVGLLGQAAFLAAQSHPTSTSPTLRGKFVRQSLLCAIIPPPPPAVGELPEPSPDARTMRERLAVHRENPACAGCHALTDPIGLGLENFDGVGAFRTTENGVTIDASGELDGVPFADARELGAVLAGHPDLAPCLVRNLYRYATGHIESEGEEVVIRGLADSFTGDQRVEELLLSIVVSEGFRYARSGQ